MKKAKRIDLIAGVACCILCVVCVILSLPARPTVMTGAVEDAARAAQSSAEKLIPAPAPTGKPAQTGDTSEPAPVGENPAPSAEPYVSPIDFDALHEVNEDIYAWIYIPNADINYPILQGSATREDYYINRDVYKNVNDNGSLFTDSVYNGEDFSDPVTVIYGHRMQNGQMFGRLQEIYSDEESFENCRDIAVYLPDRSLLFRVFAVVPFSNVHINYHYNRFDSPDDVQDFLDDVYHVRAIGTRYDESMTVGAEDQLLVLSTCLAQNRNERFLVLACRVSEAVG